MKPHRVRMAHQLIVSYNLYREMDVFRPPLIDASELTRFHSDDYVNFLRAVTPDNMHEHLRQLQRFNVGEDCERSGSRPCRAARAPRALTAPPARPPHTPRPRL
jgi:acetoin utilization deacetylase AcuC-like enzyme